MKFPDMAALASAFSAIVPATNAAASAFTSFGKALAAQTDGMTNDEFDVLLDQVIAQAEDNRAKAMQFLTQTCPKCGMAFKTDKHLNLPDDCTNCAEKFASEHALREQRWKAHKTEIAYQVQGSVIALMSQANIVEAQRVQNAKDELRNRLLKIRSAVLGDFTMNVTICGNEYSFVAKPLRNAAGSIYDFNVDAKVIPKKAPAPASWKLPPALQNESKPVSDVMLSEQAFGIVEYEYEPFPYTPREKPKPKQKAAAPKEPEFVEPIDTRKRRIILEDE